MTLGPRSQCAMARASYVVSAPPATPATGLVLRRPVADF